MRTDQKCPEMVELAITTDFIMKVYSLETLILGMRTGLVVEVSNREEVFPKGRAKVKEEDGSAKQRYH